MSKALVQSAEASLLSATVARPSGWRRIVSNPRARCVSALRYAHLAGRTTLDRSVRAVHVHALQEQDQVDVKHNTKMHVEETNIAKDVELPVLSPQLTLTCLLACGAALIIPTSPALAQSFGTSQYNPATDWVAIERWLIATTPALGYLYYKNVVLKREPDKIFMRDQVYTMLSIYSIGIILIALIWWRPEYYSRTGTTGIF
mmetsp:Transcript_36982/g.80574  ORF Transcript_36982/g.80574 Transcript_36982/m.80574 type:complete len:202 (+) Transcript_36982:177-782(+)|eukprot:CAMPEP_0118932918 /NCGR_PEP_ID=MMETSP1169-20130426/10688_1 /TAXON_ID=36882 /ORGANISM="Pyramimonas obovata, Strain CCMP722" /LENGTH=201 /DNA_ID=CAMNT_0006875623 /DNA_START=159 /DNA_END=764 /DNA_ORIENTATION=+